MKTSLIRVKQFLFSEIDKINLLELFVEKIKDISHLSDVIKKFELIKKDNFANIDEYEKSFKISDINRTIN